MFEGNLSAVSNREDWKLILEVVDDDTGEDIDLAGASIVFEVRDPRNRAIVLSATSGNGKVIIADTGFFQVAFARSEMQGLRAQNYELGCVITINGEARQFLIGEVPVLDGVVSQ